MLQVFDKTPSTFEIQKPKSFNTFSTTPTITSTTTSTNVTSCKTTETVELNVNCDEKNWDEKAELNSSLPLSLATLRQRYTHSLIVYFSRQEMKFTIFVTLINVTDVNDERDH